jgi:hypothetical protein
LTIEADFSKALMFRQALGQAEVRQLRGRTQESAKSKLVARIEETIKPLLPRPIDIQPMVSKIVDLAVNSANEMTEEQAMFRCVMIEAGRPPSESSVQIAGEGQSGNVFMCTFPMFARLVRDEGKGKLVPVYVVKACVELESAFNILNT